MRAVVAGGGIAGTVVAVALRRIGVDVVVAEASARSSEGIGAFLTVGSNGIDALAALGLGELVDGLGFATPEMTLRDHRHRALVTFPAGAPRADGLTVRTLLRADLYGALRGAAERAGAEIVYGRRLRGAEGGPDGVTARFDDGAVLTADLLVGADGLGSRLRTVLDPRAPRARYVGLLNTGGVARGVGSEVPFAEGVDGTAHFCFGKRCFLGWLRAPDGDVWWFANPPSRTELDRGALAAIDDEQWRARLRDLFAGDDLPLGTLLGATDEVWTGWNTYDFPRVPTWHRDGMVIVGDAAHAMSPSAGQGASMAIEDAVVLAQCLRDQPDVGAALARYETARRDRVEAVVAAGKRNGDQKAVGPVRRAVRDHVFMPWFARALARGGVDTGAWITGHHLDWEDDLSVAAPAGRRSRRRRLQGAGPPSGN